MKRFACALLAALLALTLLPVVGLAKTIDSAKAAPAGYTVLKRYDFETANSKITYDSSVWKRRSARSGEPSPVSGKNYMVFTPSSDYTIDTWLSDNLGAYTELPDSVQHPALSFWVYTEKNSGAPSTGDAVGVGIDQGSMGIFYATASYSTQSKTGGWRQYFVDLTQYAGKRVSFGLDVYAYKNKRVYVDDVAYVDMAIAPVALSTDTGGDFYAESRVTMQCDTPGTTIRYTADDTHPSLENGQTYTRPCDVQRGKWLLAAAFDAYGNQSAESTMYTAGALLCHPATPVTRTEKGVLYLDFTCETPGATILYTLDGSDPMMDTGKMYDGNAIPLYDDARVCVYTLADGFEDTRVYTYFVRPQRSGDVAASQDAALPLQKGTEVALSCETPGATILYTLDGSTPLPQTATVYGAPIRLDQDTWLCARSMTEDLALGNVCTFRYTVGENYDVFEPNDDLASATALGFPAQIDASLSPANDTDCYAFDVSASGRVSLAFVAQDERRDDLRMALYDAGGNMLRITNPGATGSLSQQLGAGHYFVRVTGSYGDYRLTLSKQAKVGLDLSENNLLAHMLHTTAPHSYDGGMNAGGNYLMSTAYFSRWNGPALEKDDPYTPAVNSNGTPNERKMKLVDAQAQFHVQDVLWLPLRKDSLDNDHLKSAVLAYGGVVVDYYSDWEYYTGDKGQYYYYPYDDYTAEGANHAVTLVGWDDTIPKEKFTTKYGYTPKVDGAFIFKNSWGSDWGEGGYFYASYDCELLPCYAAPLVAVGTEAADNYNVLYEYDMLGMTNAREKATSTVYTKNVYTASAATDIRAIGFYACGMEYTYDLFVQVGDGAMQPVAGGTKQYSGYYTKRLSQAVHVPQGSAFSVTVRLTTNDGDPAIYAVEMPGYDTSKAVASAGQSFVSQDSVTWEDISAAYTANNCIKVFGNADGLSADALHAGVTEQGTRGAAGEGAPLATAVVSQAGHTTGSAPAAVKGSTTDSEAPIQNLPQRYDLRQTGGVTSVKNQGVIGSCWAFAAVASLESTLLRQNNTAYAYPASIAVDKAQEKLLLTAQAPTADFAATAWVTPQNIGTDLVYWTFTGDLDCIDLHSRVSRSGEQKTLFTAKGKGVVTATAVSAVDTQKQACVTIAIAKAYKPGDVNGDGYVTSMDALWALQIALGSRAATPQQLFAAKVSGGETVTSMDALRILQLATRQKLPENGREVG